MTWSIVILGERGLERSFSPSGRSKKKKEGDREKHIQGGRERGSDTEMQLMERENERKY